MGGARFVFNFAAPMLLLIFSSGRCRPIVAISTTTEPSVTIPRRYAIFFEITVGAVLGTVASSRMTYLETPMYQQNRRNKMTLPFAKARIS